MSASLEQSRQQLLHSAAELGEHAGGEGLETFLQGYYRHVATEDLLARAPEDLLGAAAHHQELAKTRPIGTVNVEVFNPEVEEQGWASGHSIVQIVTDDMPFLVDSVTAELTRMGRAVHLIVHPLVVVRRNAAGELEEIIGQGARDSGVEASSGGGFGVVRESWMHVEVDRESDPSDREEIATNLRRVLSDVRESVEDWPKMKAKCTEIAEALKADPPAGIPEPEVEQTRRLLDWLANNHFTFLGYREYHLAREDGTDVLTAVRGSGLGLLRYDSSNEGVRLSQQASAVAREPKLLIVTKANSRATVHRSTYLDYVGIKTFDEQGEVVGEKRFLGLFTSTAYTESVTRIPVLQDKIDAIFERTGFAADSHSGKDLLEVLETYPRDELFQADQDELHDNATAVLHLQERRKTRLFLRKDEFGRFMSCIVYIPRDRYNTAVRLRMEQILRTAFEGASVDYTTRVSESALARLHFVVRVAQGQRIPEVDQEVLEKQLIDATRTWDEDLSEAARTEHGEEAAARLTGLYGKAFPEAYKEDFTPRVGVADIRHMEVLDTEESTGLNMYQEPGAPSHERRFKLYRRGPLSLTQVLPMFTHLGVEVVDERPYEISRADGVTVHIYDFGLRVRNEKVWTGDSRDRMRELFQDAVGAVWNGHAESDGFNALVLGAGLTWRQVVIIRTVAKYLRQTQTTFSQDYLENALVQNLPIAGLLVSLFEERFDPSRYAGAAGEDRTAAEAQVVDRIERALDDVKSLDHDRIIRSFLGVMRAALRTNYYQDGRRRRQQALRQPQAQPQGGARPPGPAPGVRDLGLQPTGRGRAPALRAGRARRPALERPARGLPHRGARPGQGADGQERGHRADRLQGRVLRQAAAGHHARPRRLAGRGRGVLQDVHLRPARHHRQPGRRRRRAPAGRGPPRRRRPLPRGGGRQGHGDVLRHRQRRGAVLRVLARRRVRLGRQRRLRPQGHGHHRQGRVGVGQAPLPRDGRRHAVRGLHRRRDRRHERRRLRQRHAALRAHPPRRGVRPPPHLHRPESRCRTVVPGAQAALRRAALVLGRLRHLAHQQGRRRLRAHAQGREDHARDGRGARAAPGHDAP